MNTNQKKINKTKKTKKFNRQKKNINFFYSQNKFEIYILKNSDHKF